MFGTWALIVPFCIAFVCRECVCVFVCGVEQKYRNRNINWPQHTSVIMLVRILILMQQAFISALQTIHVHRIIVLHKHPSTHTT